MDSSRSLCRTASCRSSRRCLLPGFHGGRASVDTLRLFGRGVRRAPLTFRTVHHADLDLLHHHRVVPLLLPLNLPPRVPPGRDLYRWTTHRPALCLFTILSSIRLCFSVSTTPSLPLPHPSTRQNTSLCRRIENPLQTTEIRWFCLFVCLFCFVHVVPRGVWRISV